MATINYEHDYDIHGTHYQCRACAIAEWQARAEQAEHQAELRGEALAAAIRFNGGNWQRQPTCCEITEFRAQKAERERDEALDVGERLMALSLRQTAATSEVFKASQARIDALEAHVREWRKYRRHQHCGDPDCFTCHVLRESLALVPDETTGGE